MLNRAEFLALGFLAMSFVICGGVLILAGVFGAAPSPFY